MTDEPCKFCTDSEWPSNLPKPSCRIKRDMENTDNPVTRGVYHDILEHRKEDGVDIPCPMIRLNQIGR